MAYCRKRDFQLETGSNSDTDCDIGNNISVAMEDIGNTPKKRRQTIHGDVIRKIQKTEPEFKMPYPIQESENEPLTATSSSESPLSFGPMKTLRRSLTLRKRKKGRTNVGNAAPGVVMESLSRAVMKNQDFPTSLVALHGTVKTELRRRVSTKVLRHKLHNLQDYSLPGGTIKATRSNSFNEKENDHGESAREQCSKPPKENTDDDGMEEVWVRRTTPRKAARNALMANAEMNSSGYSGSPQTSTRTGQKLARRAFANKGDSEQLAKVQEEVKQMVMGVAEAEG